MTVNTFAQSTQDSYSEAFLAFNALFSGNDSLDFKKTIDSTENVYFENKIDEKSFDDAIGIYSILCQGLITSGNIEYTEKDKKKHYLSLPFLYL